MGAALSRKLIRVAILGFMLAFSVAAIALATLLSAAIMQTVWNFCS